MPQCGIRWLVASLMVVAGCASSGKKSTGGNGGSPAAVAGDTVASSPVAGGAGATQTSSPAGGASTGVIPAGGVTAGTTAILSTATPSGGSTGTAPLGGTALITGGSPGGSRATTAGTTTSTGGIPQAGQTGTGGTTVAGGNTGTGGTTVAGGNTGTGGTTATGGNTGVGGTTVTAPPACGSRDIPIDSAGWVDMAATGCGIQGAWWWATDGKGSTLDGVTVDKAPYVPGKGMCIKGKTVADPSHTAWGAILGLDLNANKGAGWNASAQAVVGFDLEITGTSTAELRVEYETANNRTTSPPFVVGAFGRNVVLIDRAVVPTSWDVVNKGEKVDPSSIRKLQFHAATASAAADFDICVSRIRPIVATCKDYALVDASGYKLNNNVWGKESLTDYSQCVFFAGSGADTAYGWIWRWPVTGDSAQPRSYPEIMAGMSPWNDVNTGHNLPTPITSQVSFTFDLDLVLGANDAYDFAPEVWLTSEAQPKSTNVTDEIMFWFLHHTMTPAGSKVGTFSNAGVSYEVWINPQHDPGANSPVTGWQYVAFVAQTEVRKGTVLLKPFIDYLLGSGRIASARYYAGVEVGTEIVNGAGSAIIKNFSVNVVP